MDGRKQNELEQWTQALQAGRAACEDALAAQKFVEPAKTLSNAPCHARGWFDLLAGYPYDPARVARIKELKAVWPAEAIQANAPFEQYALLQAFSVSVVRIAALPAAGSVKRLFGELCVDVAGSARNLRGHFQEGLISYEGQAFSEEGQRFRDLLWLSTLQRYPAGDFVFDIHPVTSRSLLLKAPPRALPGFLREIYRGMGGWGPSLAPHIHSGRSNQLVLLREGFERSLWRMAKTIELNPRMTGLATYSWLHSAQVTQLTPHLGWLRTLFLDEGAYLIDLEPAPADAGFRIGSAKRRRLHEEGAFHPRVTLVLWRRADILAWAARRQELADPGETPPPPSWRTSPPLRVPSPRPARPGRHNSPINLWDGDFLLRHKPRKYILLVLILPALAAALGASAGLGWQAGAPAFIMAFTAAWLFQYYFFQ